MIGKRFHIIIFIWKGVQEKQIFHQLLALAMETLHFNSYQPTLEEEGLLEIEELKAFILSNEKQSIDKTSIPEKFAGTFDE